MIRIRSDSDRIRTPLDLAIFSITSRHHHLQVSEGRGAILGDMTPGRPPLARG